MSSYKNEILANNNELQNILTKIDELPAPINGLIEEYKVAAGENISAGDFVSFLTPDHNNLTYTSISTGSCLGMSAIQLDDTRVLVINSSYSSSYGTRVHILTINGTSITVTNTTKLSSSYYSDWSSIARISEDKFLVFFHNPTLSSYEDYAWYTIMTLNGTSVTCSTSVRTNCIVRGPRGKLIKMTDTSYVLLHVGGANSTLYGTVFNVSGTTVTAGTSTALSYYFTHCAVKLDNNRLLVFSDTSNSDYLLYGYVCTISGTTITKGTTTQLSTTKHSGRYPTAVKLAENKVFIAHNGDEDHSTLHGTILTVSGTTITVNTITELLTGTVGLQNNSKNSYAVSSNEVVVVIINGNTTSSVSTTVQYVVVNIVENKMSVKEKGYIDKTVGHATDEIIITYIDGKLLINYNEISTGALYGSVYVVEPTLMSYTGSIAGIANQSGSGGDTIQVYVPQP